MSYYKGKIFKIPFPFTDLSANKVRPALAVSEPDSNDDIEFLFITSKSSYFDNINTFELTEDVFEKNKLPIKSFLNTNKKFLLNKNIIINEITELKKDFFEKILKSIVFNASIAHYELKHKKNNNDFKEGDKISYGGRIFDEKEIVNLVDSSLDFWLTTGKYAEKFENNFAKFLNVKYCSLVNSGSSANLIAFMTLTSHKLGEKRIKKGDEVITVAAGFPTTVAPIIQYGAVPVFVDVTIPQYNIDCSMLKKALSSKTKAVMIAHTLGNPFDINTVKDFCDENGLWLIEDNCDALGSKYFYNGEWKYTGTIGHIGTSSFYPPHHMTMGEGGAVYTNDLNLKRIIESLRDWGRDCWCPSGKDDTCKNRFNRQFGELPYGYDHKYVYSHLGYNLKVTDMQAAVGCAQLEKLPDFIKSRRQNWQTLRDNLDCLKDKIILPEPCQNSEPSWFGFLITVKENSGITREKIVNHLESNKIQTRMLFAGNLLKHPCFDEYRNNNSAYHIIGKLKNTDTIMNNTFWIGVYPGMNADKLNFMTKIISELITKY